MVGYSKGEGGRDSGKGGKILFGHVSPITITFSLTIFIVNKPDLERIFSPNHSGFCLHNKYLQVGVIPLGEPKSSIL